MKRGFCPDFDACAGDLFGEMMLADTAATRTAPAAWLAQNCGVAITLARLDRVLGHGLRAGIALLGLQVTLGQIAGTGSVLPVLAATLAALGVALGFASWMI